jgi:amino acid adenylation domain-containing protein
LDRNLDCALMIMSTRVSSIAPAYLPGPSLTESYNAPRLAVPSPNWQVYSPSEAVPQLIAAQALANPEAPALVTRSEMTTYRELDGRANQIAHYLIALGVGPESLVGLCLERSAEAVICALGILKAGAAYLPLDPAYPTERLAFMLNDAQPRVLITTEQMAGRLSAGPWQVVAIDRDDAEISRQSGDVPASSPSPKNLAYVIYTSGSTGQPKGVEITHASLMNLVSWHQRAFEVTADDRASLLAGVGFDAAVWEAWPYLTTGASLHLPDDETRLSPELLRDWMVAEEITISFLPTALAERVMTLEWPDTTPLRFLLTGAETLRRFPSVELPFSVVNNYGPTECTVVATSGVVLPDARTTLPTIGRPIANTQVYILDENLGQAPAGTAGELYIGGAGVARGYLNRPELTSEKFIQSPFSAEPGARLYKTGDLACYLETGEIAYLGRTDEQIKFLGYRIEPNEIVAILNRHPAIQSSLVVAREDPCSEKRLVAYLVVKSESQIDAGELRASLQRDLPQYMVPAVFVRLEALPLTPNGKTDATALPAPNADNTLRDEKFIAPRTPTEERLATMLSALLGLEQVSVNDNFFMLGGHSLLGTQLIAQLRGTFGVELPLRTLFDAPTIEQLSLEIECQIMARVEAMSEEEVLQLLAQQSV